MSRLDSDFNNADVELVAREPLHQGFLLVDLLQLRHRLHEGGWSETIQRELLLKDPAVGVLLFDPERDEVVLVRQFRVGVLNEAQSPWLLELVAGMVDSDEQVEEVAIRESMEEANLAPQQLVKICEYYNSPGTSNEKLSLFCGRVDASEAGGVFGLSHEHEDIEVVVLPLQDAIGAVASGAINNAMSIIAIQWLQLNKADLLQRWKSTGESL
jgi:ADP-ribose pyrophosphatase